MVTLTLIRHGETDWNRQRRFQGSADQPLNALGMAQAECLAPALLNQHYDLVYASDLTRVIQTAEKALPGYEALHLEVRLREMDFGRFEGLTYDEIKAQHPEDLAAWEADRDNNAHGGEAISTVIGRVESFLASVRAKHQGQDILIFAHGGVIAIALSLALGVDPQKWWQFRLENTAISRVSLYEGGSILSRFNDISHLAALPEDWPKQA